jgi:hypothetical protein
MPSAPDKQRSLMRMNIMLPGQRVRKEQNHLDVWVDHNEKRVHFGPDSGLQIEPLNRGIGRFMAAQGITWAKKRWPGYTVDGTDLNNKDALNEDTRLRRDHFLRVHGFDVVYADAQHLKGSVKEVQVGDLLGDWNTEKLQIVEILEAAQMLQQAEQNLAEQEVKLKKHEEKVSKYKREDAGLRFHHYLPGVVCGVSGRVVDLDCDTPEVTRLRPRRAPSRSRSPQSLTGFMY